jgi:hypothetical protein
MRKIERVNLLFNSSSTPHSLFFATGIRLLLERNKLLLPHIPVPFNGIPIVPVTGSLDIICNVAVFEPADFGLKVTVN